MAPPDEAHSKFMLFHERRQREFKKWDLVQNFLMPRRPLKTRRRRHIAMRSTSSVGEGVGVLSRALRRFVYLDFDPGQTLWQAPPLYWPSSNAVETRAQPVAGPSCFGLARPGASVHGPCRVPRTAASEAALRFFVDAFAHMKLRRDQPALMVALRLARDRAGRACDVDNATFAAPRPIGPSRATPGVCSYTSR